MNNLHVESEKDFPQLRDKIKSWKKRFSMFKHDVDHIERSVENHIQNYSRLLVNFRQTKKKSYLEKAQLEIDAINNIMNIAEKLELMALLSQR